MICFAWRGFPQYAARCVGAFVKTVDERVVVVATKPKVPILGMEALCGCEVVWVDAKDSRTMLDLLGEVPRLLIVSGWCLPSFNRYVDEVRRSKGRIIAAIDNNFIPSLSEFIKKIRFNLCLRHRYDGYIVPGNSGRRLLKYYGVSDDIISTGMYSSDHSLFSDGAPLSLRDKKIVYVGQFIERKNVKRMVRNFMRANNESGGEWRLALHGSGELKGDLEKMSDGHVEINDFVQPENLAALYRNARAFCLLSIEEHWGVVVHEAALSGCVLLLSDRIGAADDFLGGVNGFKVPPTDDIGQINAFKRIMAMDSSELNVAQSESVRLANKIGLDSFVQGISKFL